MYLARRGHILGEEASSDGQVTNAIWLAEVLPTTERGNITLYSANALHISGRVVSRWVRAREAARNTSAVIGILGWSEALLVTPPQIRLANAPGDVSDRTIRAPTNPTRHSTRRMQRLCMVTAVLSPRRAGNRAHIRAQMHAPWRQIVVD
ncbi:hypothetical protein BD309DRAFT_741814 [Dichomitus squalens]|nr:hypothetical protein BD309DRAFT_741814 [Dichomitus squalens]